MKIQVLFLISVLSMFGCGEIPDQQNSQSADDSVAAAPPVQVRPSGTNAPRMAKMQTATTAQVTGCVFGEGTITCFLNTGGSSIVGSSGAGTGVEGTSSVAAGVRGQSSTGQGVYGTSETGTGVLGATEGMGDGTYGMNYTSEACDAMSCAGSRGESNNGPGVIGSSTNGNGVYGICYKDGCYGVNTPNNALVGKDLVVVGNKWGKGLGWKSCPRVGDCACPDGQFFGQLRSDGTRTTAVFCVGL